MANFILQPWRKYGNYTDQTQVNLNQRSNVILNIPTIGTNVRLADVFTGLSTIGYFRGTRKATDYTLTRGVNSEILLTDEFGVPIATFLKQ